jgi:ketosteroid isomerase-like protein
MDIKGVTAEAMEWLEAWNARDLDRILNHYTEAIEFTSPTVRERWGIADGRLSGKEALRKHFSRGLELAPHLSFTLLSVLIGIDSILIIYRRESGKIVADLVVPDEQGKAQKVTVFSSG